MKMVWKNEDREGRRKKKVALSDLPFDASGSDGELKKTGVDRVGTLASEPPSSDPEQLSESYRSKGNQLAEEGKFREALTKWEAALLLTPDRAVLHEQKAQVLLELGDSWNALKAASRATELEPSWPEAWTTLARAQLNFGEPEASIQSFDKASSLKPGCEEIEADKEIASRLVKRRKQLSLSGSSTFEGRFVVQDRDGGVQNVENC